MQCRPRRGADVGPQPAYHGQSSTARHGTAWLSLALAGSRWISLAPTARAAARLNPVLSPAAKEFRILLDQLRMPSHLQDKSSMHYTVKVKKHDIFYNSLQIVSRLAYP